MSDEDWDFKLESEAGQQDDQSSTSAKRKTLDPSSRKNTVQKKKRAPLKVEGLDTPKKKVSRSALAKKDEADNAYLELSPPGLIRRIKATFIDLIIIGVCIGIANFLSPFMKEYIVDYVRENNMNLPYSPDQLLKGSLMAGAAVLLLVLYAFPIVILKRSPGKNMMLIRVGVVGIDKFSSRPQVLLRELILKPLSLLSTIGVLMIFCNERKRALHGFLSGTTLYLE